MNGRHLVFRCGAHTVALPLEQAVEVMRPLPIVPLAGAPEFVLGLAVVRGAPTPVVAVERLLTGGAVRLGEADSPTSPASAEAAPGRRSAVRLGEADSPTSPASAEAAPGRRGAGAIARFITVRAGARTAALAVEAVLGIRTLADTDLAAVPPLLERARPQAVAALAAADRELLVVLRAAQLVPEPLWTQLTAAGA
jgi:purine-binding chemotaxis protein CheW